MQKILTVVVPAYNAEAYLRTNLESYGIDQIREDVEILVIDDGSTDHTGDIAEEYARRYPGSVRVFHKENGGHGSGINWGIRYAEGMYFKVVDADDWVEPVEFAKLLEILRKQLPKKMPDVAAVYGDSADRVPLHCISMQEEVSGGTAMERQPADIVYSGFLWVVRDGKHPGRFIRKCPEQEPFKGVKYGKCYQFDEVADRIYIRMHNMAIRTTILKKQGIRLDEYCYYVDTEYITYPIPWVKTICFTEANVYRYRIGRSGQSVELSQMRRNEKDYDRVAASLFRFYRKLGSEIPCTPAGKDYICGLLSRYAASKIKIILSYPASKEKRKRLVYLDRHLKEQYPEIYAANQNLAVDILRGSRYLAYWPVSMLVRWKYRERQQLPETAQGAVHQI